MYPRNSEKQDVDKYKYTHFKIDHNQTFENKLQNKLLMVKSHSTHRGTNIRITVDFSSETMQARR